MIDILAPHLASAGGFREPREYLLHCDGFASAASAINGSYQCRVAAEADEIEWRLRADRVDEMARLNALLLRCRKEARSQLRF